MNAFSVAFLAALAVTTALKLWLAMRQLNHVHVHRTQVPAAFADRISSESHHKAAGYTCAKTRLGMLETLLGTAIVLVFTFGGGLQVLSDAWAGVLAFGGYGHGIALIVSVTLIASLLEMPASLYRTFVIEERFGFNRITPALYAVDAAKQLLIGVALGIPLLFLVLWLMSVMGSLWWLWVWCAWVGFNLLVIAIYPSLIAPLFNKFTPLEDEQLRIRIGNLLAKCGFRARGLFVMDSSRRSSHGNAYFTGFGRARRIVLFDTLIARLSPAGIEAVLAHELGHFRHRHVWKRMALLFSGTFALLALLGWLIDANWFFAGLNVHSQSTAMALILFLMAVPVFTFPLQPLSSMYSRMQEYEADSFAAKHTAPKELVQALINLYQDNAATLTPDPLHSAFYDSHPPAIERVARLRAIAPAALDPASDSAAAVT